MHKNTGHPNPLQHFAVYPEKFKELKKAYSNAVRGDGSSFEFDGQQIDITYCKYLIEAVDQSGQAKDVKTEATTMDAKRAQFYAAMKARDVANKIINNLYGVDSDEELDDLLEEH